MSRSKVKIKYTGFLNGINIIADPNVPADTMIVVPGNATWYRHDRYSAIIRCKNRLKTAWRALTKGEVEIEWFVRSDKKDKTFKLEGKTKGWL